MQLKENYNKNKKAEKDLNWFKKFIYLCLMIESKKMKML